MDISRPEMRGRFKDNTMRGYLSVAWLGSGVIALVEEATGYQEIRAYLVLATILKKYIAQELQS